MFSVRCSRLQVHFARSELMRFDQGIPGEIAVLTQIDFPEQKVADRISAELFDEQQRIHNISFGFRHFVALDNQPAMPVNFSGQLHSQRHEDNRPDDAVETHDLLADQMNIRRPELGELLFIMEIPRSVM